MADNCPDPENLKHTRRNPIWEIPSCKNSSDTCETYAMQKAYSSHARQCMAISANSDPSQIFVRRIILTSCLDTWHGLTQWVTHKILGMIAWREHKLLIFEVPHCEPMGKSATGEDMLTFWCQRQLWKVGIRENFSIFGSKVKNTFQTISCTLAILPIETPPGGPQGKNSQSSFQAISRYLAIPNGDSPGGPPLLR